MGRRRKKQADENSRKQKKSKNKQKKVKEEKNKGKYNQNGYKGGPELEDELFQKGLRVKYMMADGNCFFRSLGDQLYGHDRNHLTIRQDVVSFMDRNRELFLPFVEPCLEDDEDYDSYIDSMNKVVGSWAGDFEVHAASLCFDVDICIYQTDNGGLQCLYNRSSTSGRVLHMSYHGGEHYNSVRKCGDYDDSPPTAIELGVNGNVEEKEWTWKDEKRIMQETGCFNDGLVHSYLEKCQGNVNEVIEMVYQWMEENNMAHEKAESDENNPMDIQYISEDEKDKESSNPSEPSAAEDEDTKESYPSSNKVLREDSVVERVKKPANKTPCPCGSGKMYKKCCKIIDRKREREASSRTQSTLPSETVSATNEMALLYI